MLFDNLADRFQKAIKTIRFGNTVTEEDLKEPLREIRKALIEADVNFLIAKEFIAYVKVKVLGTELKDGNTPRNIILQAVKEKLTDLLGGSQSKLAVEQNGITAIMLVGLQGAGKTTTAGKLARFLKHRKNKKVLLIAADIYRPAAITQLEVLGNSLDIKVFSIGTDISPVEIARQGIEKAKYLGCDTVIIDTAGRLHIDEELMQELRDIKAAVNPTETLFVVDAMSGQDSLNVAAKFNEDVGVTGVIVTKMDGDARGGVAINVKSVTGVPIKCIGSGEKLDALEEFHPDRIASRILGLGDLATFAEHIKETTDISETVNAKKKLESGKFDLEDFLGYLEQLEKMGSMKKLISFLPKAATKGLGDALDNVDEKELKRVRAIIQSMTVKERQHPEIIKAGRKKRIAAGCGMRIQDVNKLLKKFEELKNLMKMVKGKTNRFGKLGMNFPMS